MLIEVGQAKIARETVPAETVPGGWPPVAARALRQDGEPCDLECQAQDDDRGAELEQPADERDVKQASEYVGEPGHLGVPSGLRR